MFLYGSPATLVPQFDRNQPFSSDDPCVCCCWCQQIEAWSFFFWRVFFLFVSPPRAHTVFCQSLSRHLFDGDRGEIRRKKPSSRSTIDVANGQQPFFYSAEREPYIF